MTNIEWTDETWNPVRGCTRISPGCGASDGGGCYAERQAIRLAGAGKPYEGLVTITNGHPRWTGKIVCDEAKLDEPLHWRAPRRVFVNSMSDLFHEGVPEEFIDRVFAVMALAREHTFQILTKRPERMRDYCSNLQDREVEVSLAIVRTPWWESPQASPCAVGVIEDRIAKGPLPNVWLGTSVENQGYAENRIPHLLETAAAVRFVSVEPMLGPVTLSLYLTTDIDPSDDDREYPGLDWVICGGESGPGARPFNLAWGESLRDQCKAAGVSFFMKQIGSKPWQLTESDPKVSMPYRVDDRKGGDPEEWPEHLRIREFPQEVVGRPANA